MPYSFTCDIPKTSGGSMQCSFHFSPDALFLRRTHETYTEEELEHLTAEAARALAATAVTTHVELLGAIFRGEVLASQARDMVYTGFYHLCYATIFRFMPTAPLVRDEEEYRALSLAYGRDLLRNNLSALFPAAAIPVEQAAETDLEDFEEESHAEQEVNSDAHHSDAQSGGEPTEASEEENIEEEHDSAAEERQVDSDGNDEEVAQVLSVLQRLSFLNGSRNEVTSPTPDLQQTVEDEPTARDEERSHSAHSLS